MIPDSHYQGHIFLKYFDRRVFLLNQASPRPLNHDCAYTQKKHVQKLSFHSSVFRVNMKHFIFERNINRLSAQEHQI